jgi:predicted nucleic acid-binding protein
LGASRRWNVPWQCSSYDAEFVVLAEQVGCPLLTLDRKLLQLFPDLAVQPGS